jgi:hypothetical protein
MIGSIGIQHELEDLLDVHVAFMPRNGLREPVCGHRQHGPISD